MSSPIQSYLQSIATHLQAGNATEHTHRPALHKLLTALLPHYRITHEPRRIACGSPDFEIIKDEMPIGHLKAKDTNADLDKIQKSEQLKRYLESLNNLLLTNYLEFRWFVDGEYRSEMTVKLAEVDRTGKLRPFLEKFARFDTLLKTFVETPVITLRSPTELAKKMAHIARLMNEVILKAYHQEEKTGKLHGQLESFRQVLIDTLRPEQFSDMLAQTVCYGLFAAKCSTPLSPLVRGETGELSRQTASYLVPKTNPWLKNLFNQIAGIELDDRLVWLVDHLVAVLKRVDMTAILENFGKRTRQEDPVVHFYETFLAYYDTQLREVRGVYYTPEPVVSYIVRSVDWVLTEKFGLKQGLADNSPLTPGPFPRGRGETLIHKVQILDPATGTGTFLQALVAWIYERFRQNQGGRWSDYVAKHLLPRLHGFEVLMAPYTIAHLKLSLQLQATGYDFSGEEQLRVFLRNTLDEPHHRDTTWLAKWLSDEAGVASGIKQQSPVMVIVGNPPYSYDSTNKGAWISQLIRDYYQVDGQPLQERNPKGLQDDYVKFIRFAQWRINQTGYGILGFVTNHGYLDNPTFRGMRHSLMQEFDEIYVLDLHGNGKKKEKSPDGSVDQNVFDIQQGVAIGIFVKHQRKEDLTGLATVYHAHLYGTRAFKYQYLMANDLKTAPWTTLQPQSPFYLLVPQDVDLLAEYEKGWKVTEVMPINSVGIVTARDNLTIHYTPQSLRDTLHKFGQLEIEPARHQYELGKDARDWTVNLAQQDIQEHGIQDQYLQLLLYRPFDKRYTYYTGKDSGFICRPRWQVMQHLLGGENLGLTIGRAGQVVGSEQWNIIFCTDTMTDMNLFRRGGNNLFPLYLYPIEKTGLFTSSKPNMIRKPNFAEDFIKDLETRLDLQLIPEGHGDLEKTISALDVLHYMYAVFHSPTYRQRYAEFLKIDFPRLPLTSDRMLFKQLTELGGQLVKIHLLKAETEIENDCSFPIKGNNLVEKLAYKEAKVYINQVQYFDHVTPEVWEFHIGGYQVCEKWLKDRKGRVLSLEDCSRYLYILAALAKTREVMERIDDIIGEFPIH